MSFTNSFGKISRNSSSTSKKAFECSFWLNKLMKLKNPCDEFFMFVYIDPYYLINCLDVLYFVFGENDKNEMNFNHLSQPCNGKERYSKEFKFQEISRWSSLDITSLWPNVLDPTCPGHKV